MYIITFFENKTKLLWKTESDGYSIVWTLWKTEPTEIVPLQNRDEYKTSAIISKTSIEIWIRRGRGRRWNEDLHPSSLCLVYHMSLDYFKKILIYSWPAGRSMKLFPFHLVLYLKSLMCWNPRLLETKRMLLFSITW